MLSFSDFWLGLSTPLLSGAMEYGGSNAIYGYPATAWKHDTGGAGLTGRGQIRIVAGRSPRALDPVAPGIWLVGAPSQASLSIASPQPAAWPVAMTDELKPWNISIWT
jgi:hypothetical protein